MELLILSFVAGVLTVLAPCTLPFLPIILGTAANQPNSARQPMIVVGSLIASIFLFTLLLKASTALLGVPQAVWQAISGGIILIFGLTLLFPGIWERVAAKLSARSNSLLANAGKSKGWAGSILVGAALGPVFSSCSPTYALILASVLPAAPLQGVLYLAAYSVGLGAILLLVALLGQGLVSKLRFASNPRGWFKRSIGLVLIVVGAAILFGIDKKFEIFLLERGWYKPFSQLEQNLR